MLTRASSGACSLVSVCFSQLCLKLSQSVENWDSLAGGQSSNWKPPGPHSPLPPSPKLGAGGDEQGSSAAAFPWAPSGVQSVSSLPAILDWPWALGQRDEWGHMLLRGFAF